MTCLPVCTDHPLVGSRGDGTLLGVPRKKFRRLFLVYLAPLYCGFLCSADLGAKTFWGVSSRRLFHVSSLEPMCDEFSGVVEFIKLFREFSQIAAVILLCNVCFCLPVIVILYE